MKIKLLKASKIYNTLNFDLVFNPDVNILYGINGCGKTTVLKLLNKIFNCDFQYFESINFREIMLKYSIEKETYNIKFVKSKIEKEKGAFQITSNHPIIQNTFDNFVKLKKKFKKKNLFDSKQYLRLTTGWKSIFKSIYISIQRGIEGMDLPYSKTNKYADQEFNEFIEENYIRQGHVPNENQILSLYQNFLEANYTANKFSGRTRLYKNKSVNSTESAILSFKSIIQMKLVEYSRYSKKLEEEYTKESYQKVTSMMKSEEILKRMRESKKSVMNILIEEINEQASNFKGKIEIPSIQDFQNLLDNLEKEQENIQNKKNISTDYVILFVQFLKISELTGLLKIMNESKRKKYKPFKLLISKINEFFVETDKIAIIDEKEGIKIHFIHNEGQIVPLKSLSSGEKQILIFFMYLIFESDKEIMLYDEPDLSLHIDWQEKYIDSIREINQDIQIFLATHSIAICGSNYYDKQILIKSWGEE